MFLGQEVHYCMVYIAYFTELNLKICDYAQKRRICPENFKYTPDKNFHGHFCPRRKAAKFCRPAHSFHRSYISYISTLGGTRIHFLLVSFRISSHPEFALQHLLIRLVQLSSPRCNTSLTGIVKLSSLSSWSMIICSRSS